MTDPLPRETTGKAASRIIRATIDTADRVTVWLDGPAPHLKPGAVHIDGGVAVNSVAARKRSLKLGTTTLDLHQNYAVRIEGLGEAPLLHEGDLESLYSEKRLGCILDAQGATFRVFAPRALRVDLLLFRGETQAPPRESPMSRDEAGVWETRVPGQLGGWSYGYRITGGPGLGEIIDSSIVVSDPYTRALCTENTHHHRARSLILSDVQFDWGGDSFEPPQMNDLIIYEAHVRDLTAHPSSGVAPALRGKYLGLLDPQAIGGLNHLRRLGVNAVEFLPIQEFANIEVPFGAPVADTTNTWNPYARNHWGYMTSCFFAPESYYASDGSVSPGSSSGGQGRGIAEFKQVVKSLHEAGIAVIMDVVYNHVSQYDHNSLKYIDKQYYFRLDGALNYQGRSGMGNDLRTSRPMARRLILDSIEHWLREYHVDGFRFDLATMIDRQTMLQVVERAQRIKPDVILIAEPWGGGKWAPKRLAQDGFSCWNDWFRNAVKGWDPKRSPGFMFGKWHHDHGRETMARYPRGTLLDDGGLFPASSRSINYLESHDDHTLGDFVRLATGRACPRRVVRDLDAHVKLTDEELRIHKLGALFLFTTQGPVMIAQGQEWARSKVIAPTDVPDKHVGRIDDNSYEKDNETNWLNYDHLRLNAELVEYYRGLVALRRAHPSFRSAPRNAITMLTTVAEFGLGFGIATGDSVGSSRYVVLMNSAPKSTAHFDLPPGGWRYLVDGTRAGALSFGEVLTAHIELTPQTGVVLIKQ